MIERSLKAGLLAAAMAAMMPMAAQAVTISGVSNGVTWAATSNIVGVTSTATIASGGNPLYSATAPNYRGTAALIMDYGGGNLFICSGSLLSDRRSIVTAGHCVSDGTSARPISTTAYFYGGGDPDQVVPLQPAATAVSVSQYFVNSEYTGEVIDQNDIAVLRLSQLAPDFATSYDLYTGDDLTGVDFNVAGYGRRSDTGGSIGANLGTGRLRQGDNRYDFRLGDADFDGFWTDVINGENFFGTAEIDYSYLSDFDNGLATNDASCRILPGLAPEVIVAPSAKYCNLGRGASEVSTAGGNSGGPQFVNGQLASVTSYGLSFGRGFGDIDNALNSSFGEFNGFVPIYIHRDFIATAVAVPEPSTWAVMLTGFLGVGGMIRRRKAVLAA